MIRALLTGALIACLALPAIAQSTGGGGGLATPVAASNGGTGSSTNPTSAQVPVANGSNVFVPTTLTGDTTVNSSGVTTTSTVEGGSTPATVSGALTSGHCPQLSGTSGGLVDSGGSCGGTGRLIKLGALSGANFNITTDQAITLAGSSSYIVSNFILTGCSGTGFGTAAGAFYSGASKTGVKFFNTATTTSYSVLTSDSAIIGAWGLPNGGDGQSVAYTSGTTIYFSLTTPSGAAATCNITVLGYDIS